MSLTYQLKLSRESIKFLTKQEMSVQVRIQKGLLGLCTQPPIGDIVPLKGRQNQLRLRVGAYRIIFEMDHKEKIIFVLSIDNRGDVYK